MTTITRDPGEPDAQSSLAWRIQLTGAQANFRNRLQAALFLLAVNCLIMALLYDVLPPALFFTVALVQTTPSLASLLLNLARAWRQPDDRTLVRVYLPISHGIAVAVAASNGLCALVIFPYLSFEFQVLYVVILAGISGLQAIMTAVVPFIPYTVLFLTMAPQGIWFFVQGLPHAWVMAAVTVIWLVVVNGIVLATKRIMRSMAVTSYENEQLAQALEGRLKELEEARRQAEAAQAARTRFFMAASHDLRQPLHALGILTDLLHDADDAEHRRALTTRITQSLRSTDGLLAEVLDLARLDEMLIEPKVAPVRVETLLEDLQATWACQCAARGLAFTLRHMSGEEETGWIASDRSLLIRILNNYLNNALRHGRGATEIALETSREADVLRLTVVDDGDGIPESEQSVIFEEFVQGYRALTDPRGGLGLGLAIVQRTARLLDHTVGFESTKGQGARFWVEVPLSEPDTQVCANVPDDLPGHILLIEDDPASREALGLLLERWGCTVRSAACIDTALAAISKDPAPDAIIADFRLAGDMTGDQVVEALESRLGRAIPAVFVTGDPPQRVPERLRRPDTTTLFKPVPPARLRAALSFSARPGASVSAVSAPPAPSGSAT